MTIRALLVLFLLATQQGHAEEAPLMSDAQFADVRGLLVAFTRASGGPVGGDPMGLPRDVTTLARAADALGAPLDEFSLGMWQAANDMGFVIRQAERDDPGSMETFHVLIREETGKTLDEIVEPAGDVAVRVLARGEIETMVEYYVIANLVSDVSPSTPMHAEREALNRLFFAFEQSISQQ